MFLLRLEFGGVTYPWKSATLVLFGFVEWKIAQYPVILLRIFNNQSNIATLAVCVFHGITYISVAYFLPFYFQAALGYSPILSGVWSPVMAGVLAIMTVGASFYMFGSGRYLDLIWLGTIFMTLGFWLFIDF